MLYTALSREQKEIRLIHLQSALHESDSIVCHFSIVNLDKDDVQYEALSYVWGDRAHNELIYIEGVAQGVTQNLYQALLHLRYKDRKRTLWVDAICIDQTNLQERTHQVAQMKFVYSLANSVVVWLGAASEVTEMTFKFLQFYDHGADPHFTDVFISPIDAENHGVLHETIFEALYDFMNLPWFNRIWTAQEWALSRKTAFHAGKYSFDGDLFGTFILNIDRHVATCCRRFGYIVLGSMSDSFIEPLRELNGLRGGNRNFVRALSEFRNRNSTDPRDKLYGLLALAEDSLAGLLQPDYTSTVEYAYETWTLSLITSTKRLDILSQILPDRQQVLNLPSFVPDWTVQCKLPSADWIKRTGSLPLYNACGSLCATVMPGRGVFKILGVLVDRVATIVKHRPSLPAALNATRALVNQLPGPKEQISPLNRTRKETYWLTFCGGMERDERHNKLVRAHTFQDYLAAERWNNERTSQNESEYPREFMNLDIIFNVVSRGRHFAITELGRMGWVPKNAQVGDRIAVLTGGSVPFVLRQKGECYTVVADAYIHGIMDGEAMKPLEELENIVLV